MIAASRKPACTTQAGETITLRARFGNQSGRPWQCKIICDLMSDEDGKLSIGSTCTPHCRSHFVAEERPHGQVHTRGWTPRYIYMNTLVHVYVSADPLGSRPAVLLAGGDRVRGREGTLYISIFTQPSVAHRRRRCCRRPSHRRRRWCRHTKPLAHPSGSTNITVQNAV